MIDCLALPFFALKWQMAVFGAVVQAVVRTMFDAWRNLAFGRAAGSQLVGNEAFRGLPHNYTRH